jgi:hypothetical protein
MKLNKYGLIFSGWYVAASLPFAALASSSEAKRAAIFATLSHPWSSALFISSVVLVYGIGWGFGSIRAILAALNGYGSNWS